MKQSKALQILKSGKNVFLTGSAGAGKTYVLNQYIDYLKERNIDVATTASTGIAATHMNGMTIHAWAGIGVKDMLSPQEMKKMKTKKYLKDNLDKVKVLIIDEISMLHKNQINLVQQVLQYFKNNFRPFGGIQVVLSGDFFQLPPVGKYNETTKDRFAFMSQAWLDAQFNICYLTEQHRQEDNELNEILNEIRKGITSQKSLNLLEATSMNSLGDEPTKLYTHNIDVHSINAEFLSNIKEGTKYFIAKTKGNEKLVEMLKKSVLADEKLALKKGAKVMFVKNNYEKGYINGSIGEVIDYYFDDEANLDYPIVKLKNKRTIIAKPETWAVEDDGGKVLAYFEQVPLRLAWAITVHKSQGMTLDEAEIDLSKTFEKGQGYVALSRLKEMKGLKLFGINDVALQVDSLAMKADKRFQELSNEIDKLNETELEKEALQFVKDCDGLTEPKSIEDHRRKKAEKKSKKSTHMLTLELILKGCTITQIEELRNISAKTVIAHIGKIKQQVPDAKLDNVKPKKTLINKVQKATEKLKGNPSNFTEGGKLKLRAIFDELGGKVDYEEISLAQAFLN